MKMFGLTRSVGLLSAFGLSAAFPGVSAGEEAEVWKRLCGVLSELAEKTMEMRQQGIPMAKMMEAGRNEYANEIADALVIKAYESPRFNTPRNQQRAIEDFRDEAYLDCVKSQLKTVE